MVITIIGCAGSLLLCRVFVVVPGLSLFVVHRLLIAVTSRCKSQALGDTGSLVAAHRLS